MKRDAISLFFQKKGILWKCLQPLWIPRKWILVKNDATTLIFQETEFYKKGCNLFDFKKNDFFWKRDAAAFILKKNEIFNEKMLQPL